MENKKITLTTEGLQKLEDELEYLKTKKRKEVSEKIKVALGFGDLSENSEYDEAKNEQAQVEIRINELENMLKADNETDGIVVSYAKLEEYQSKLYSERKNMVIASELMGNVETVYATFNPWTAEEATVSLTVEKFGDDNYVIAVVRLKEPAGD